MKNIFKLGLLVTTVLCGSSNMIAATAAGMTEPAQLPAVVQNTQKILVPVVWDSYDLSACELAPDRTQTTSNWQYPLVTANIDGKGQVTCLLMDFSHIGPVRSITDIKPGEGFITFGGKMHHMPAPVVWNGGESAKDLINTGLKGDVSGQHYEVFSALFLSNARQ
jgi:hypothetical protein